jgi:hypothetical protein
MMRRITIFALALLVTAVAWGQGVVLVGPTAPIDPKDFAQIMVSGLTDQDLPAARVEWAPAAGVTLIPAKTWGGQPFLWFSSRVPGKFTVTVTVNGWRKSFDSALVDAKAARIDPDLLAKFTTLSEEVVRQYPVSSGSCVVEVSGTQPDPIPPPVPTPGVRRLLLIHESGEQTPEIGALIVRLHQSPYLKEKKHSFLDLDKDGHQAGTQNVHPAIVQALKDLQAKNVKLPALVLYDSSSGAFVAAVEVPKTVDEVVDFVKKNGG